MIWDKLYDNCLAWWPQSSVVELPCLLFISSERSLNLSALTWAVGRLKKYLRWCISSFIFLDYKGTYFLASPDGICLLPAAGMISLNFPTTESSYLLSSRVKKAETTPVWVVTPSQLIFPKFRKVLVGFLVIGNTNLYNIDIVRAKVGENNGNQTGCHDALICRNINLFRI